MSRASTSPAALSGVRVVDLTTNYSAYAGRLLADLGAEVIRFEPASGGDVRKLEPSQVLADGSRFSFAHAFLDASKLSVAADVETAAGRAVLDGLIETADVVLDTPLLGEPSAATFDYHEALKKNPRLIVASITPYGFGGPRSEVPATDLTSLASGGLLSLGGYSDSEPVAVSGQQSQLASAIFAVAGILAAVVDRENTGKGRWIDVSAQECIAFALEDAVPEWYINGVRRKRNGDGAREAGTGIYPCMDGHISMVAGRLGTAKAFITLTEWIASSDVPGAKELLDPKWKDFKYRQSPEGVQRFAALFGAFCTTRGKEELYREGQKRQIAIAPVNTIADVAADAQLAASGYFKECFQPALSKAVVFPGAPYRLSRTPAKPLSAAPAIGEHNHLAEQTRDAAVVARSH